MYSFFFLLALALYKKTSPWSMDEIASIKDQSEHSFITSQTEALDFSVAKNINAKPAVTGDDFQLLLYSFSTGAILHLGNESNQSFRNMNNIFHCLWTQEGKV